MGDAAASPGRAAIGLGSNLGDRERHLRRAVHGLGRLGRVEAVGGLYETAPLGGPHQDPYLNTAVLLVTTLEPEDLLQRMLALERRAGRVRRERWGPRTLDLDLLLYGRRHIDEHGLTVPHPELLKRRFVIEPLLDAWPAAALPGGESVARYRGAVADQEVRLVAGPGWHRPA